MSYDGTAKVLIFSLNGPMMGLIFLHIKVSGLNYLRGCNKFWKSQSNLSANNSKIGVAGATVSPFILVSLESGHLENSQRLAFSRRASHPDSALKSCKRRPTDKGPEKAPKASGCGTKVQTGGLCGLNAWTQHGPSLGLEFLSPSVWMEHRPVGSEAPRGVAIHRPWGRQARRQQTAVPEADARWMRLICIALNAGRCSSRGLVYLFPTGAPLCRSSPAVSGKPSILTPA